MSKLTDFQNKLLKDLETEFRKLNPEEEKSSEPRRFSVKMIEKCISEEAKFLDSLKSHNIAIAKMLKKSFDNEIKAITKEFGKLFGIQVGHKYPHKPEEFGTYEKLSEQSGKNPKYGEATIFIISRTKTTSDSSRTNGMRNVELFCHFKVVSENIELESGKIVKADRIIGLSFSNRDYLHQDSEHIRTSETLDGLIQSNADIQRQIISLCE